MSVPRHKVPNGDGFLLYTASPPEATLNHCTVQYCSLCVSDAEYFNFVKDKMDISDIMVPPADLTGFYCYC